MLDASVVVPTFNRHKFLKRSLDSLAAQTLDHDRFEVVVVNDCGIDPSVVTDLYKDDLQIRLVCTPENLGVSGAINFGIEASQGKYLALIADDDCYYPEHLELMLSEVEKFDGDTIVYSDAIFMIEDENGVPLKRNMISAPAEFNYEMLLLDNYIHAMSPFTPREAFEKHGGFRTDMRAVEDWELWLRLAREYKFHHVLRVTADYRVRSGADNNTTREIAQRAECIKKVYELHPVPEGSELAAVREATLAQLHHLTAQHSIDTSILFAGVTNLQTLLASVEKSLYVNADANVELVAYVSTSLANDNVSELDAINDALLGRLSIVCGDLEDVNEQFVALEKKACGMRFARYNLSEPDNYCITPSYTQRFAPLSYNDDNKSKGADISSIAKQIAQIVDTQTIITVGADFEDTGALSVDDEVLDNAVIVCDGVLERLVEPKQLLTQLNTTLEHGAAAILLTTCERELTHGSDHSGPPLNPAHIGEWSIDELAALIEREGFAWGDIELTHTDSSTTQLPTVLTLLYRDETIESKVRNIRDAAKEAA